MSSWLLWEVWQSEHTGSLDQGGNSCNRISHGNQIRKRKQSPFSIWGSSGAAFGELSFILVCRELLELGKCSSAVELFCLTCEVLMNPVS